jgi:hypothetical protein
MEGYFAQRTGVPAPDPLDLIQANQSLTDAIELLSLAGRAQAAEYWRLRQLPAADRAAVLQAWTVSVELMVHAIRQVEAMAATSIPMSHNAARALNILQIDSEMSAS